MSMNSTPTLALAASAVAIAGSAMGSGKASCCSRLMDSVQSADAKFCLRSNSCGIIIAI